MHFEIPTPSMTFDVPLEDGAAIRMRRHGNPDGVRILITHGNGFAADAYYPYWRHLLSRFDMMVFDFRNHGQNVPCRAVEPHLRPAQPRSRTRGAGRAKTSSARKTVGIFHSMSGRTAMKHAIEIGWRWDALVLFDPPNVPPPGHPQYEAMESFESRLTEWAKNRRRRFDSVEELVEEYRQLAHRRGFGSTAQRELMARSVLRKAPDGDGYELVCAPENESAIYARGGHAQPVAQGERIRRAGDLIGCDPDFKGAPATGVANRALGPRAATTTASCRAPGTCCRSRSPRSASS
jgi:pimeloyl-ACP methyl ester carboxylesterase